MGGSRDGFTILAVLIALAEISFAPGLSLGLLVLAACAVAEGRWSTAIVSGGALATLTASGAFVYLSFVRRDHKLGWTVASLAWLAACVALAVRAVPGLQQ